MTKIKNKGGRPKVITKDVIGKLEKIFALDGTVKEACFFAGINPDTYYEYVKNNPAFSERVEALREQPVLLARRTVVANVTKNYANAMDYLSRKKKGEFSTRTELTGDNGRPVIETNLTDAEKEKLLSLLKRKK